MNLFNIFHKKEPEPNYWQIRAELDRIHDEHVEYFAERSRQWDRNRKEVEEVSNWSMRCFQIVCTLSQKQLIDPKLATDYMIQEGWTAYLPIEVGPILKKIWESNDSVLIHSLYKSYNLF